MPDSGNTNGALQSGASSGKQPVFDANGGIDLRSINPSTVLRVQTRNNTYTVIPQVSGEMLIWGHPEFCPEPILIAGLGSAHDTGYFREGYLCPGLRLSFPSAGRRVATSNITAIQIIQKN
jgi:hypothetical protein